LMDCTFVNMFSSLSALAVVVVRRTRRRRMRHRAMNPATIHRHVDVFVMMKSSSHV